MITYSFISKDELMTIEVKGHANYADEGYDIVCNSVSMACQITVNTIYNIEQTRYNIVDVENEKGYFKLDVKVTDDVTKGIIETLKETLQMISTQYPRFVKMKK